MRLLLVFSALLHTSLLMGPDRVGRAADATETRETGSLTQREIRNKDKYRRFPGGLERTVACG